MTVTRYLILCLLASQIGVVSCRRTVEPSKAVAVREDGAVVLNLMSFNIRYENSEDLHSRSWQQRVAGAVKMIRREKPDIIGVQEAMHGQVADLWASLPEYNFHGVGRDDGKYTGEYSGIFYRTDRFRLDESECGTFWLSDTPEIPGSRTWGNEIPRVATWLRLTDLATMRGFYIFNTHWDHQNQTSREHAALLIARRIDARKHADEPVALIGDFNSIETNPGMIFLNGRRSMLASKQKTWPNGLVDAFQSTRPNEKRRRTLHFWTDSREGNLKVDHILVSHGAKIENADIISTDKPMVSDHFPVTARVVFPLKK